VRDRSDLTTGKKGGTGPASVNLESPYGRSRITTGFMGKQWDGGDIAFRPETWALVYNLLKPGAHLVAFSGTRTYHRMVCAIEDAGFEIRDQLAWVYGSGFPKSHDVSKAIDREAGAEREVVLRAKGAASTNTQSLGAFRSEYDATVPATDAARDWQGWGTALKPAWEPICLARKPLIGTVAANVLAHGTGAINVDGCRIESGADYHELQVTQGGNHRHDVGLKEKTRHAAFAPASGRWPANLIHDGSDEVLAGFPESVSTGGDGYKNSMWAGGKETGGHGLGDSGSAARFFYCAKAGADDRFESKHPTVKPVALMRWLCRLVTPPGGTVLDPFAGTGTTGIAALREGFTPILIEREAEYHADIQRRIAALHGTDTPLFAGVA